MSAVNDPQGLKTTSRPGRCVKMMLPSISNVIFAVVVGLPSVQQLLHLDQNEPPTLQPVGSNDIAHQNIEFDCQESLKMSNNISFYSKQSMHAWPESSPHDMYDQQSYSASKTKQAAIACSGPCLVSANPELHVFIHSRIH